MTPNEIKNILNASMKLQKVFIVNSKDIYNEIAKENI